MTSEVLLFSKLHDHRTRSGLSQADLAARVGVSRQAIIAIEAGRQTPSTVLSLTLARSLDCRVEDLFSLPELDSLPVRMPPASNTSGRVVVGCVDGRWVAHPAGDLGKSCDGVIRKKRSRSSRGAVEPLCELADLENNILIAGCAPLLGMLGGRLGRRERDARATWVPETSTRALALLKEGFVHMAGVHLVSTDDPGGHAALIRSQFTEERTTLINLTRWRQGLLVARGNPKGIRTVSDALGPKVTFVRREPGAGSSRLLNRLLAGKGRKSERTPQGPVAGGHEEVARLIQLGVADTGIAIEPVAIAAGLDFIPLVEESFDLVVPESRLSFRPIARLLELMDCHAFRTEIARIPGYDMNRTGQASTVSA